MNFYDKQLNLETISLPLDPSQLSILYSRFENKKLYIFFKGFFLV